MMLSEPQSKKTILCIDDDVSILRYEKALLERSGYEVLTAPSGRQGLQLAITCQCDVVLLDYEMYGMNGREVALEIRLVKPGLVIILLSGRDVPMQALAAVDGFVPKLEASQQLVPMIAELCSRSPESKKYQESA